MIPRQVIPAASLRLSSGPVQTIRLLLLASRNADGGWGYYAGKGSRLEPTCWALLALSGDGDARQQCARALGEWPVSNGVLLERPGGQPNYAFHALALLTLRAFRLSHRAGDAALLQGLVDAKGIQLEQSPDFRQDNSLQAWSWVPETFSWVEPTAWSLLALKKSDRSPTSEQRIAEGERLLVDRACSPGGWNFGNSRVYESDLPPYVPTTAIALLALQDRPVTPSLDAGLKFLAQEAPVESSSMALGLGALALSAWGRTQAGLSNALERQLSTTAEIGSLLGIGIGLYALKQIKDPDATFRL
jgi:hypothetical protein